MRAVELEQEDSWAGADSVALLLLHAYRGDEEGARAVLERRRRNLPVAGQKCGAGGWELLPAAVEALALLGERAEAFELYPVTLEAVAMGAVIKSYAKSLPETTAGIAAACGEQWGQAGQHFETALQQAQNLPHMLERPEVRRWYARMLLDRDAPGDRERAREFLTEAIPLYREIGMPKHLEMVQAMLTDAH